MQLVAIALHRRLKLPLDAVTTLLGLACPCMKHMQTSPILLPLSYVQLPSGYVIRNEIGNIYPITEVRKIAQKYDIPYAKLIASRDSILNGKKKPGDIR